jgi:hypothetical protein
MDPESSASAWSSAALFGVAVAGLLVGNLAGVVLVVLQLPGTWLIVLLSGLFAWWRWDEGTLGTWTLATLLGLALLGELLELLASTVAARRAGGTRAGSVGALLFGIVGAVVGTFFLPVPVLGTVLGACVGAGLGSILFDRSAGLEWGAALRAGGGAATGRLVGSLAKIAVAVAMWVVVLVALVF